PGGDADKDRANRQGSAVYCSNLTFTSQRRQPGADLRVLRGEPSAEDSADTAYGKRNRGVPTQCGVSDGVNVVEHERPECDEDVERPHHCNKAEHHRPRLWLREEAQPGNVPCGCMLVFLSCPNVRKLGSRHPAIVFGRTVEGPETESNNNAENAEDDEHRPPSDSENKEGEDRGRHRWPPLASRVIDPDCSSPFSGRKPFGD